MKAADDSNNSREWLYQGRKHGILLVFPLIVFLFLLGMQLFNNGSLLQYIGIDHFWRMIDEDFPTGSLVLARQLTARALTIIVIVFAARAFMIIGNSHILIDASRVIATQGHLTITKRTIPVSTIASIEIKQSPVGTLWNWGTLKIEATGGAVEFPWLKNPLEAVEAINRVRGMSDF